MPLKVNIIENNKKKHIENDIRRKSSYRMDKFFTKSKYKQANIQCIRNRLQFINLSRNIVFTDFKKVFHSVQFKIL